MSNLWTIFGARGVIGRRVASRLRDLGAHVFEPTRGEMVFDRGTLGHVIYAAGLTADFRTRPYDTIEAHVNLLAELLRHASFDSLLYLSSTRVYAHAASGREDAPIPVLTQDPSDLYNLSKLMGESLCLQDPRIGVRVVRLSNVVGGEDMDSINFVPSLMREARAGRVVLRTSADSTKDYIHIEDVVEILPRIVVSGRERIYNLASGVQTTHAQLTAQLAKKTGCTVEVTPGAPSVRFIPIDIERIRKEFDFQPRQVLATIANAFT
jgi:nucleoside-diphosphate-sugar epimerase